MDLIFYVTRAIIILLRVTSYYMQIHYQFDLIYAFGARLQPELECLSLDWNERLMICNFPLGLLTFPVNDSASCLHLHEGPTYIGYTERLLRERIAEHGKNGNTEVSEHLRECGGDINQESFEKIANDYCICRIIFRYSFPSLINHFEPCSS